MTKQLGDYDPKELEEQIIALWKKEGTFQKSLKKNEGKPTYNFYDGPPFANGLPHFGHNLVAAIKDSFGRFETMNGKYVPRRLGWDTHGLPVEYEIEKEIGTKSKRDIEEFGVEKFCKLSKESVFKYKDEWESMLERLGRWADSEDYWATLDDSYIESVWWIFSEMYKKGLVYKDFRSTPYCPRCATPLSNFELNQGYKDGIKDPAVYVKFKLEDSDRSLVAWTTTPWSLPGNIALAINPEMEYIEVEVNNERLIIAEARLEILPKDEYTIIGSVDVNELVGKKYIPQFEFDRPDPKDSDYTVQFAEFVEDSNGSGIVHIAPYFGEDDLALAKKNGLTVLKTVDEYGTQAIEDIPVFGIKVKDSDIEIIKYLKTNGLMLKKETIEHTYPYCWRCDSPLIYYAIDSWFVAVSTIREKLVENNNMINWTPEHVKTGRFGKWIAEARDWSISRNRFWGSPLPIWIAEETGEVIVVSSIEMLKELSVEPITELDLHKPGIDKVKIRTESGAIAERVPEVFDCWFESGSMPFASMHYPFEHKDDFSDYFPAQFISEGTDQTRGWFYTLHVIATIIMDKPAFKNVVVNGLVMAEDGKKMSKSLKNYPDPKVILDKIGADSLRYYLLSSSATKAEDFNFVEKDLITSQRRIINTFWQSAKFFSTYANIDSFEYSKDKQESNLLIDKWIKARIDEVAIKISTAMQNYDYSKALDPIDGLIDDLSNWYIRINRDRFWKSENDSDKFMAYTTLYESLQSIAVLLAPWCPFISDYIYRHFNDRSVHLEDWPKISTFNELITAEMKLARSIVNESLSNRSKNNIKLRQPLSKLIINSTVDLSEESISIIKKEVNVLDIEFNYGNFDSVELDTELTDSLRDLGLIRDLTRLIQDHRKTVDYNLVDKIDLQIKTKNPDLIKLIENNKEEISKSCLLNSIDVSSTDVIEEPILLNKLYEMKLTSSKANE